MPVFNDWEAVEMLCLALDRELHRVEWADFRLLLINDASSEKVHLRLNEKLRRIQTVDILWLRRNLGHQRAIAIGLAYAYEHVVCNSVVVMDADGEDQPADVVRLLAKMRETGGECIVFAERGRRLEDRLFRLLYLVFRIGHRVLTGFGIRFGNFSVIPAQYLSTLVVTSEIWSHYAASVLKSKIPFVLVRADKGRRLAGRSQMNLVALVVHGLTALSTFQEIVGTRVLLVNGGIVALILVLISIVVLVRIFTGLGIPGWATYTAGLLLILTMQILAISLGVVFFILTARNNTTFLPIRDYRYFVHQCTRIYPQ
jgi:glycosyltransferase involved in cell wall biosynthesis